MALRMLARVTEKWSTLPVESLEVWGAPAMIMDGKAAQRYFLRVAALHPQTEETSHWTVTWESATQWERYPIGSWLLLQVSGWRFLAKLLRGTVILEPA
jgi:hypothetical protein